VAPDSEDARVPGCPTEEVVGHPVRVGYLKSAAFSLVAISVLVLPWPRWLRPWPPC